MDKKQIIKSVRTIERRAHSVTVMCKKLCEMIESAPSATPEAVTRESVADAILNALNLKLDAPDQQKAPRPARQDKVPDRLQVGMAYTMKGDSEPRLLIEIREGVTPRDDQYHFIKRPTSEPGGVVSQASACIRGSALGRSAQPFMIVGGSVQMNAATWFSKYGRPNKIRYGGMMPRDFDPGLYI